MIAIISHFPADDFFGSTIIAPSGDNRSRIFVKSARSRVLLNIVVCQHITSTRNGWHARKRTGRKILLQAAIVK